MDKFQRGKIYAIRAPNTDMVYIGSTISTLTKRISHHRNDFKKYNEGKRHYVSSYKLLELEGYYIELIENYPCADRNELNRREGEIIRETKGCINKCIAGRTSTEWREDNKETISIRMKKYRQDNKEKIKKYRQDNKEKIKKYRQDNKEKALIYDKKYRQDNKETILAKANQKHNCSCGGRYTTSHKARHFKSKKHKKYLDSQ